VEGEDSTGREMANINIATDNTGTGRKKNRQRKVENKQWNG
jgi:hypothetical protein